MKLVIFFATLVMSATACAHMELGTYVGKTADGQACQMTVEKVYYENDVKHPLNERVAITVNNEKYLVGHPPVISVSEILASFDHDQFQGILPTATGAKALVVKMEHTPTFEGPSAFNLISHEYKANKREILNCANIVLQ
ncbi:MAG: hypothetical protein V4736_13840 [Bdellovibrionota bacterium]